MLKLSFILFNLLFSHFHFMTYFFFFTKLFFSDLEKFFFGSVK